MPEDPPSPRPSAQGKPGNPSEDYSAKLEFAHADGHESSYTSSLVSILLPPASDCPETVTAKVNCELLHTI